MKHKIQGFLALGVMAVVIGIGLFANNNGTASAAGCGGPIYAYGRAQFCGYFANTFDNFGTRLWTGGIPAAVGGADTFENGGVVQDQAALNSFINFIITLRGVGGQNQTVAEFIIDTMEGPGLKPRGDAWTLQADWEQRLNKGVAEGILRINWNYSLPWNCGQVNTYYQPPENDVAPYQTSPATLETPACGAGVTTPAIRFYDPQTNRNYYVIKRNCGNPIGALPGLPSTTYQVTPSGSVQTNNVTAGSADKFLVELKTNGGPANSEPGTLEVNRPANIDVPCAAPCTGPGQTQLKSGATRYDLANGYRNGSAIGERTPDWWWNTKNIPPNTTVDGQFNFTVSAAAPPGPIDFYVCYSPPNETTNAPTCVMVVLTVVSQRSPVVVGENGDVHAGGGICGSPLDLSGNVEGYPSSGSNTDYVVSATGTVSDFGSNGSTTGGTAETLGKNGGYSPNTGPTWPAVDEVCREDLLKAAEDYVASGGTGYGTITAAMAANLDPSTLNAFPVYYWSGAGGTLHLNEPAGHNIDSNVTIVAEAGTVEIDNNIVLNNAVHTIPTLPALGIIAAGNINISLSVTDVDAYLFSNSTIDTCYQGVGNAGGCVGPSLTVNGFLMGKSLAFHREGAFNVDGTPTTETIILNPQIYLNPPKFFDSSVDNTLLEGQGEKPPLY
jgi:hypothetical protein